MKNLKIYASETIKCGIAVPPNATKKEMAMAILYMTDEIFEEENNENNKNSNQKHVWA